MKNLFIFGFLAFVLTTTSSCNRKGCTNSLAINYNESAKFDNGTCQFKDAYGDIVDSRGNIIVAGSGNNGNNGNGNGNQTGPTYTNFSAYTNTTDPAYVYMGNSDSGWTGQALWATPECGNTNCFNSSLAIYNATYDVYAENTTLWWESPNYVMTSDYCNTLFLNATGSGIMPEPGGAATFARISGTSNRVAVIIIHNKLTDPIPAKYMKAHTSYVKTMSAKQQANRN